MASHTLVTWLLGIKLANKFSLVITDSSFNNQRFNQIWLMTSISHDYGYFKKELLEESFDLRTLKYNLLTDHYDIDFLSCLNYLEVKSNFENYFSYSYDEIKNYFEYSKQYQKDRKYSPNHEKCDHGIVGACMLFNEYCEKCDREILKGLNQSFVITQIRKIACIIGASHNIFKSSSIEQDNIYKKYKLSKLLSTSAIRVRKENNILSLLSLVDTIECTKRFSTKENSGEFLHQKNCS